VLIWAICNQKCAFPPQKIKISLKIFTPYIQRTYGFPPRQFAEIFVTNPQVHPFIEGSPFMAPSELLQVRIIFSSGFLSAEVLTKADYPGLFYEL
jgi:hypothetical protein